MALANEIVIGAGGAISAMGFGLLWAVRQISSLRTSIAADRAAIQANDSTAKMISQMTDELQRKEEAIENCLDRNAVLSKERDEYSKAAAEAIAKVSGLEQDVKRLFIVVEYQTQLIEYLIANSHVPKDAPKPPTPPSEVFLYQQCIGVNKCES